MRNGQRTRHTETDAARQGGGATQAADVKCDAARRIAAVDTTTFKTTAVNTIA